jgi:hypothetical protein
LVRYRRSPDGSGILNTLLAFIRKLSRFARGWSALDLNRFPPVLPENSMQVHNGSSSTTAEASAMNGAETTTHIFAPGLVLHFGYHKCLTMFYVQLMKTLSAEFRFGWEPIYDDVPAFHHAAQKTSREQVILLTDGDDVQWERLPDFRASHFIRDPRDLVVSGYYYHLWTNEEWAKAEDFDWDFLTGLPKFVCVEADPARRPQRISYQTYLNTLGPERGMLMEMVSRERTFDQMRRWNFDNPRILEMRYEEIVGNEEAACSRLFDHYRFSAALRTRGLELAREFGLNNLAKRERSHVRSGAPDQWRTHFTPAVKEHFKHAHGDLLIRLGYERDYDW